MAVQAQQYPTNATAFQPEYRNRGQQALPHQGLVPPAPNNLVEYQQLQSAAAASNQLRLLGLEFNSIQQSVLKGQVNENKTDDVEARNLLGPRKRSREFIDTSDHQRHPQLIKVPEFLHGQGTSGAVIPQQFGAVSTGLQLGLGNKGQYTSGATGFENSSFCSALGGEVLSQLQQQRNEIDQYLRLQEEKVRQMLAEKTQQHSRVLLGAIERFMARCLKERALKVEDINRRNKELEEKLKQLTLETRMWQKQARDYEGLVTTLRNNLHVVALSREQSREGCGDSEADNSVCSYHDDAHARMCMENKELKEQRTCRMCRSNDVCILLLPCQHLCLCKDCETRSDVCPICHTAKDASFQVFMA